MTTPNNSTPKLSTVDAILSHYAKSLKPGETIRIPLYKGKSTTTSSDPLMERTTADANKKKLEEKFPKMAKFIETVEKPDFLHTLRNARLYQDYKPKAHGDSDDEEEDKEMINPRRRRRARRKRPPKQHWILQSNEEFVKTKRIKKMKVENAEKAALYEAEARKQLSNRYEGLPESNHSSYVLFSASESNADTNIGAEGTKSTSPTPSISIMPLHGFVSFAQPAKHKTLSMHDAENAIATKNVSRYMMHNRNDRNMADHVPNARRRLLGNLPDDKDDLDDLMADVAFREEKAGVSTSTRQDLLSGIGDGGIKVDHDGILGGANDAEFAGGRRFGQMKSGMKKPDAEKRGVKGSNGAIDDDFYQQDVGAQFDRLDCDLDALFDNNDQDMGAGAQDDYDLGGVADVEDDDSDVDEEDELDLGTMAAKSFATKTGMKAIFANAKGENIGAQATLRNTSIESKSQRRSGNLSSGSDRSDDEREIARPKQKSPEPSVRNTKKDTVVSPVAPKIDKNGLMFLTQKIVREEIWLNGCTISYKRLAKKFKATKKRPDRRAQLDTIVMALCHMDDNHVITLKQHFRGDKK